MTSIKVTISDRTPLHLMLMIHYYAIAEPYSKPGAPATIKYTQDLLDDGLIRKCDGSPSGYRATEKGEVFVRMLCTTPLPVPQFTDPRTNRSAI